MTLKPSFYDGGKRSNKCEMCGASLPYSFKYRVAKCAECAQKIADKVAEDFEENKGHYLTEAILTTNNEQFISIVEKGAKLKNEEPTT